MYYGFDVEGVFLNPKFDFAWLTYERLLSSSTREKFPRELCEEFDSKYDDGRYLNELYCKRGHATGTWPLLSLMLCALDGISDSQLISFAEKHMLKNPGIDEFISYLKESGKWEKVYLLTSSYAAAPLIFAREQELPAKHVFTLGFQYPLNWQKEEAKFDLEEEVKKRSPIPDFLDHRYQLEEFLNQYLELCKKYVRAYEGGQLYGENGIYEILTKQENLITSNPNLAPRLRETLRYFLIQENGLMGSRGKVRAMQSICEMPEMWAYIGDGIVDGMPIHFARYGISLNMTNPHALKFSKLNVATSNLSNLIPVYENLELIISDPGQIKENFSNPSTKIFTPEDIRERFEEVVKANREAKEILRGMYSL